MTGKDALLFGARAETGLANWSVVRVDGCEKGIFYPECNIPALTLLTITKVRAGTQLLGPADAVPNEWYSSHREGCGAMRRVFLEIEKKF